MVPDHRLLLGTLRTKLKKYADTVNRPPQQYNVQKLMSREIQIEFNCAVRNRFEAIEGMSLYKKPGKKHAKTS